MGKNKFLQIGHLYMKWYTMLLLLKFLKASVPWSLMSEGAV